MSQTTVGMLLPLFVAVPLLAGGVLAALGRLRRVQAWVVAFVVGASTLGGAALIAATADGSAYGAGVGPWPDGVAIPFVADMATALMLTLTSGLTAVTAIFAYGSRVANSQFFAPFLLVLVGGVNGALLTADLFNLFVFIEVMLLPSYGLFVLSANRREPLRRVDGARLYVTLNLLTSTILVAGIGFVYGVTGTVNLAVLAGAAAEDDRAALAAALILFALSIKASVVPMHGWLAKAYPATSPAVTALFAALHTKVALYAIFRVYSVVYDGDPRFLWVLATLACLTLVIGALASIGARGAREVLAWQMVSGIGGILLGLALFGHLGLSAGLFYMIHHMVAMACLLAAVGAIEVRYGVGGLKDVRGLARREPLIAVTFFIGLLSLAGIPPFSGFVGKLAMVLAGVAQGSPVAVTVFVTVSLLSLWALLRLWHAWFWGEPRPPANYHERLKTNAMPVMFEEHPTGTGSSTPTENWAPTGVMPVVTAEDEPVTRSRVPFSLALPAVITAVATTALGLGGEALLAATGVAADGLLDVTTYVEAVMGG